VNADAVTVQGLTVERGGKRILDGVGFTVPRGAVVGVIGPNGAGKSAGSTWNTCGTAARPRCPAASGNARCWAGRWPRRPRS
jgi:ABC-type multidrug transport system ATPase subunit